MFLGRARGSRLGRTARWRLRVGRWASSAEWRTRASWSNNKSRYEFIDRFWWVMMVCGWRGKLNIINRQGHIFPPPPYKMIFPKVLTLQVGGKYIFLLPIRIRLCHSSPPYCFVLPFSPFSSFFPLFFPLPLLSFFPQIFFKNDIKWKIYIPANQIKRPWEISQIQIFNLN